MKYKVGDKVTVINGVFRNGESGLIEKVNDKINSYTVIFPQKEKIDPLKLTKPEVRISTFFERDLGLFDEIIFEAKQLQEVRNKVSSYNHTRMIHIIELFYFRKYTKYVKHWSYEITQFPATIPKLKGSNKLPSSEDIKKWMLEGFDRTNNHECIDNIIEEINNKSREPGYIELPKITRNVNSALWSFIYDLIEWIAEQYSYNGRISHDIVLKKLKAMYNDREYYLFESNISY